VLLSETNLFDIATKSVEMLKNVVEMGAVVFGGIWTYFNFFEGRTFKPRLDCAVKAVIEERRQGRFLKVENECKNISLARVPLDRTVTVVEVFAAESMGHLTAEHGLRRARWSQQGSFLVFQNHEWAEPNEPLRESLLIGLPDALTDILSVKLKVASADLWWTAEALASSLEARKEINDDVYTMERKRLGQGSEDRSHRPAEKEPDDRSSGAAAAAG
jgi:hypothetical protein